MKTLRQRALSTCALLLIAAAAPSDAADRVRLRPNDAIGEPGGRVAIVLRTYSPQAIGVGQICMRAAPDGAPTGAPPFAELESYEVFSAAGDAITSVDLRTDADGQELVIEFVSESATINTQDGPLAVIFLRLSDSAQVGQRFPITVDPGGTTLFDPEGNALEIEPRSGELTVRAPSDPYLVSADGDELLAGEIAELAVETHEPFGIASGRLFIKYRKRLAAGPPVVVLDRRHGRRQFTADVSRPGKVIVEFTSPDASYNEVPGQIVRLYLPTKSSLQPGETFPIKVRRNRSFLLDADGQDIAVRFKKDRTTIEAPESD